MKIRTRLLLFLLPTLVGSIALISSLFAYNWYREILEGFQTRLKTAVVSASLLIDADDLLTQKIELKILDGQFPELEKELGISRLYLVPLNSPEISSIPKEVTLSIHNASEESSKRVMTGYAPIYSHFGHIAALVAADIDIDLVDKKFNETLFLIICSSGIIIILMVFMLFLIANKISKPVQRLNNSALAIAAGQYGESIDVKGPKEIAELSNTLNTMSECLHENINRLKENSLLRERMYGEYECSMMLQHLMLQKNIENCKSDAIAVKPITFFSDTPKGFLLDFPKTELPELFQIRLAEAKEEGFEAMYQLITQYKHAKKSEHTTLILNKKTSSLEWKGGSHLPFFWSMEKMGLAPLNKSPHKAEAGDYFFIGNSGFFKFYKSPQKISDFLRKVLKVFAHEGLETTASMLQKEIAFAAKRKELENDLHLLAFQILNM